MKGLDDGPDGLNEAAWERAMGKLPRVPHNRKQPIPTIQIPALEHCPGCGKPAHASETDDDGYHPGCRP